MPAAGLRSLARLHRARTTTQAAAAAAAMEHPRALLGAVCPAPAGPVCQGCRLRCRGMVRRMDRRAGMGSRRRLGAGRRMGVGLGGRVCLEDLDGQGCRGCLEDLGCLEGRGCLVREGSRSRDPVGTVAAAAAGIGIEGVEGDARS